MSLPFFLLSNPLTSQDLQQRYKYVCRAALTLSRIVIVVVLHPVGKA